MVVIIETMEGSTDSIATNGEVNGKTEKELKELQADGDDDDEVKCGYGRWKPKCLQPMANAKALLAAICWFTFMQGKF